jgi:hypothetical protein
MSEAIPFPKRPPNSDDDETAELLKLLERISNAPKAKSKKTNK